MQRAVLLATSLAVNSCGKNDARDPCETYASAVMRCDEQLLARASAFGLYTSQEPALFRRGLVEECRDALAGKTSEIVLPYWSAAEPRRTMYSEQFRSEIECIANTTTCVGYERCRE